MTKDEILDYVTKTPHNTNRAVLRSMLTTIEESGFKTHICSSGEYDTNGLPIIEKPDEKTVYLVPDDDDENNLYKEYVWIDDDWELFGTANGLRNLVDGSAAGSVRGINTAAEDDSYHLGSSAFAEGNQTKASGIAAHAEGLGASDAIKYNIQLGSDAAAIVPGALSSYAHVEGCRTTTNENTYATHAEGYETIAGRIGSGGMPGDHAEGYQTYAAGGGSHAEGQGTKATGNASHAEGMYTSASNAGSHAEGTYTQASGVYSHAEGSYTIASRDSSHAEGDHTEAAGDVQHVFGKYNIVETRESTSNPWVYVEIVGNGTNNARSNARTLDWSGNESLAGSLTLGMGTADEVTITAAQLKQLLNMLQ